MGLFNFLSKFRNTSDPAISDKIRPREELLEAVDFVAKLSHPNIYYVSHYRKKLMPAVEHTLKYADELIVQLPTPISIEADSWKSNPFVRKTFLDNSAFKDFFSKNKALNNFFQKTNVNRCCALLVMTRKERKTLGVEIDGEIVRRDVLQTSVDFSDHQIVAPMASEEETRKELSLRVLELLASHSLEDILSLISLKKDMEPEKRILEIKMNLTDSLVQSRKSQLPDQSDTPADTPDDTPDDTHDTKDVIGRIDKEITEVRVQLDEPEDYLNRVTDLLFHPEQFLKSEPIRMLVNDMNIIVKGEHPVDADDIRFTELKTSTGLRKAVVLVDFIRF
jgi:hypothetical protein